MNNFDLICSSPVYEPFIICEVVTRRQWSVNEDLRCSAARVSDPQPQRSVHQTAAVPLVICLVYQRGEERKCPVHSCVLYWAACFVSVLLQTCTRTYLQHGLAKSLWIKLTPNADEDLFGVWYLLLGFGLKLWGCGSRQVTEVSRLQFCTFKSIKFICAKFGHVKTRM